MLSYKHSQITDIQHLQILKLILEIIKIPLTTNGVFYLSFILKALDCVYE